MKKKVFPIILLYLLFVFPICICKNENCISNHDECECIEECSYDECDCHEVPRFSLFDEGKQGGG